MKTKIYAVTLAAALALSAGYMTEVMAQAGSTGASGTAAGGANAGTTGTLNNSAPTGAGSRAGASGTVGIGAGSRRNAGAAGTTATGTGSLRGGAAPTVSPTPPVAAAPPTTGTVTTGNIMTGANNTNSTPTAPAGVSGTSTGAAAGASGAFGASTAGTAAGSAPTGVTGGTADTGIGTMPDTGIGTNNRTTLNSNIPATMSQSQFDSFVGSKWDVNGDGVVTMAEWQASTPAWYQSGSSQLRPFGTFDINRDGRLTQAEVNQALRQSGLFREVDTNHDGTIDSFESAAYAPFSSSSTMSANTGATGTAAPGTPAGSDTLTGVSNTTATGSAAVPSNMGAPQFNAYVSSRIDADADGYVSAAEWQSQAPGVFAASRTSISPFATYDTNRDGRLSPAEMSVVMRGSGFFGALDTNNNGVLDQDESRNFPAQ